MQSVITAYLKQIENEELLSQDEINEAKWIYNNLDHVILSYGKEVFSVEVTIKNQINEVTVILDDADHLIFKLDDKRASLSIPVLIALYIIEEDFDEKKLTEGKKYSREGMVNRVLKERQDKAKNAEYILELSKNLYGEHQLTNEKGKTYKITLHDFSKKTGHINNIDWQTNKLGTTKHILYVYNYLNNNPKVKKRLDSHFPFIDVYTNPQNNYKISWFFPDTLTTEESDFLNTYFNDEQYVELSKVNQFFKFVQQANTFERIKIRKEVYETVENYFQELELQDLEQKTNLDFSKIKGNLYPYQEEGVRFSVFKKGVIIADEMGLGKTLQAISTAILKKDIFDFKKTLVICPASVKHQWASEVHKFTNEKAVVIEGFPENREKMYQNNPNFFHIINYETVLRDLRAINKASYDFVILDEAQKIKNYETKTSNAVKSINKKHALVITGTPIENKILDLYSITNFLDPKFLAPQWEFSYQHCIFDVQSSNKIVGYYNLQELKKRIAPILIRRQKHDVFDQLPQVIQKNVYVDLYPEQANYHASYMRGISKILHKKHKTAFDMQRLMLLLASARMVCNSTFLIDKETHQSSKLIELKDILFNKLDLENTQRKIIIFSEWVTMLNIIGEMLTNHGITFSKLTGSVPVKKRKPLIENFEKDDNCKVFLSSESGGAGLNLQVADTVINFELPWNPAKKNQRIGRIDRIGQKKDTLLVYNLLCNDSIEISINAGLGLKQDLFNSILNANSLTDTVDFSTKGKSQFIQRLEQSISENINANPPLLEVKQEEPVFEEQEDESFSEVVDVQTKTEQQEKTITEPYTEKFAEKNKTEKFAEMETVMSKGIEFLSGIYKMSTGKEMTTSGKPTVQVNKDTGEVSIKFKIL